MKKLILILIIHFISFSQNFYNTNNLQLTKSSQTLGCIDLDETLIDLISIFGDISLLDGLLGCEEIIPTLESGILSAFLPFDIPLNCNTDLTPFGYLDVNLSNICECSCQKYLTIDKSMLIEHKIINTFSILGKKHPQAQLQLQFYDDGSVEKKYFIK